MAYKQNDPLKNLDSKDNWVLRVKKMLKERNIQEKKKHERYDPGFYIQLTPKQEAMMERDRKHHARFYKKGKMTEEQGRWYNRPVPGKPGLFWK